METAIYQELLQDGRWKSLSSEIKARDKHECRNCGSQQHLEVHHRQYHQHKHTGDWAAPWEYDPIFLVTLCKRCHSIGHELYQVPVKQI
jgi:5-methylcytosine-specific restriction endonuclease McrA